MQLHPLLTLLLNAIDNAITLFSLLAAALILLAVYVLIFA